MTPFLDAMPYITGHWNGLKEFITQQEYGQAWIFCSEDAGICKEYAFAFAADFILQGIGQEQDPSVLQELLNSHHHPDLIELHPEGRVGLHSYESIKEFLISSAQSPSMGRHKAFVIHRAHRMLPSSSNALLKRIEEPLPGQLIILTAPSEESCLATIVSRCRRVSLPVGEQPLLSGKEDYIALAQEFGHWFGQNLQQRAPYGELCYWLKRIEHDLEQIKSGSSRNIPSTSSKKRSEAGDLTAAEAEHSERLAQGEMHHEAEQLARLLFLELEKAMITYTTISSDIKKVRLYHHHLPLLLQALERGLKLSSIIETLWLKLCC
jgi:DNA polymerase-3 subunit delta'